MKLNPIWKIEPTEFRIIKDVQSNPRAKTSSETFECGVPRRGIAPDTPDSYNPLWFFVDEFSHHVSGSKEELTEMLESNVKLLAAAIKHAASLPMLIYDRDLHKFEEEKHE